MQQNQKTIIYIHIAKKTSIFNKHLIKMLISSEQKQ
jgi:hypothetical protein